MIVNSLIYEKLGSRMDACVDMIRAAITDRKPILIRHHADCDGYAGAVVLERAILDILHGFHRRESDIFHYYRRSPSRAPFYEYSDATKDVSNFLQEVVRHEHKTPLIIVIDNGSSREDLLSLRKLKVYGAGIIVIDHHPINPDNEGFIDVHINPHHVSESYGISAGMLCAELAAKLNKDAEDAGLLAALAGVADKCTGSEIDQYLEKAKEQGFTREMIADIAECIDFETYYLGFLESRYMVDDLFFGDLARQKNLLAIIRREIDERKQRQLEAIKRYIVIEQLRDFTFARLETDKITHEGEYPKRGKAVSMALEYARQPGKPALAIGYGTDFLTLRADKELDIDLNGIIARLAERYPYAMIAGGGHARAGSISFIQAARDEVIGAAIELIKLGKQ